MTVMITGAANGLGAALAKAVTASSTPVIAIDKSWPKKPGDIASQNIRIDADLSKIDALPALARKIASSGPCSLIIHNAAVSATGSFETIPPAAHQSLIDINVTAPLILTQQLLNENAIKSGGTFVFIASLSVQVGYPGAASYAASKAAIANFAQSLKKALRKQEINVLTVYPGPINTDQARRHAPPGADASKRMSADRVADQILKAVKDRRQTLIPGTANRAAALVARLAPSLLDKMMKKIIYDKLDRSIY